MPRERRAGRLGSAKDNTAPAEKDCYAEAPHRQIPDRDSHEYVCFPGMTAASLSDPSVILLMNVKGGLGGMQFDGF